MKLLVWLALCLIWGTTRFFIVKGLVDLPPIAFASARYLIAFFIIYCCIKLKGISLPCSKQYKVLALTGLLQFTIRASCVFWSQQYIESGLSAVLQSTVPALGLIFAWIHLANEKITGWKIIACLMGFFGIATIFVGKFQINNFLSIVGCLVIVIGSSAAAEASVLTKAFCDEIHPATIVFGQMMFGIPPMLLYSLIVEGNPLNFHWSYSVIFTISYLGIIGTALTFWLYYWLLKRVESTKAMTTSLITPLVAVLTGVILLNESFAFETFLGGGLILFSVWTIIFGNNKTLQTSPKSEL
jgi:drug/metabolite transporter (DMT)-like permease